ncbi:MAG: hypothetical protein U9P42_05020, partial [Candidatus Fermentibacteria bacterium]|nr:hypothetical protein [Candidatus Fermentibacteria bacterium]
ITDTIVAPSVNYTDIFVNEWGVVVFTNEGTTIAGAPDENGNLYYGKEVFGDPEVDAPVIWIHGAFFEDATLTVKAVQGSLTALFPDPDVTLNNDNDRPISASWNISAPQPPSPLLGIERPELIIPQDTPFGWAMGFWGDVPSHDLFSAQNGDYMANFLYYEAAIPYWGPTDDIFDAKILAGFYAPDGLLITAGYDPQVERIQLIPLPDGAGIPASMQGHLSDEEVCDIICDWAGGNLKSEEITALWQTWEPFFKTMRVDDEYALDRSGSNEQWILFPLPWDVVEQISTIHLEVHDSVEIDITYNRLFLGLVRLY